MSASGNAPAGDLISIFLGIASPFKQRFMLA
jgi:hypothetical protein